MGDAAVAEIEGSALEFGLGESAETPPG